MQDGINAAFELFGAFIMWMNVYQLYKDKIVRGIHYSTVMFMTSWGFWNVYYYPHLDQLLSGMAAGFLAFTNLCYLIMILYYRKRERDDRKFEEELLAG